MPSPCIVAFCKKRGTHIFPKDEPRRTQWVRAIKQKKSGLTIRNHSKICSDHFKPCDFVRTPLSALQPGCIQKTLKKTAIPSLFPWTNAAHAQPEDGALAQENPSDYDLPSFNLSDLKKTYERPHPTPFVEELPYFEAMESETVDPLSVDPLSFNADIDDERCDGHASHNIDFEEGVAGEFEVSLEQDDYILEEQMLHGFEKDEKSVQTEEHCGVRGIGFGIHYYKKDDKAIHFFTGLENFNKFMLVFHTLGPSSHQLTYFYGRSPINVDTLEQFFITLLILRRHKPYEEIAMMYNISIKQVYNVFITWIKYMSLQWKNVDLWVNRESVKTYMPLDFYDKYPSTRVILDATEFPVKKPRLPLAQQVTFSSYKNRNTAKVLIGITPGGMISYVSPCYGGSVTDRQIIERSSILNRFDYSDEIMVDKGLNVQDIFLPYGVKVNMPSFFKKGSQIGTETLASNRKVASKRVHVERVIGLLKTYKILCQPMNQTEFVLSSDIVFICAMLVNFRSSIINKYA